MAESPQLLHQGKTQTLARNPLAHISKCELIPCVKLDILECSRRHHGYPHEWESATETMEPACVPRGFSDDPMTSPLLLPLRPHSPHALLRCLSPVAPTSYPTATRHQLLTVTMTDAYVEPSGNPETHTSSLAPPGATPPHLLLRTLTTPLATHQSHTVNHSQHR